MIRWDEIDALVAPHCKAEGPGCALGVFKHGKAIYLKGYGSKRVGENDPIGSRTVFQLASVSKQFTAFCVLLLRERGKLSLDDGLRKYMPEFGPRFDAVKIHHLIQHSGGMPSMPELRWTDLLAGTWSDSGQKHVRMLARQPALNFEPGEAFCYSNDGYFLLGEIVRRCSGMSLARFADLNIF
ncbi:MAG TPA: serine hydrolase domain-containing protein, partial [bacterium]|nr:serine hydrolase domain-containing protein [bacterium]